MIDGSDVLTALCLMLIFEGLIYGLFPVQMKKMIVQMLELPESRLQNFGLGLAVFGAVLLYFMV